MISIDTALLRELVSASSVANDAIDNAVDALNRVSTHNDWGCKEKYAINEYAITNRNKIKQLQENSRGFLNVITQVSNEFETSENSIINLFSSVESLLSGMLSIPVAVVTNGHTHTGTPVGSFTSNFESIIAEWQKNNTPYYVNMTTGDKIYADGTVVEGNFDPFKYVGNPLDDFTKNNLTEAISVCNFEDIDL